MSEEPGRDELDASVVITTYRRQAMLAELLERLHPQIRERAAEVVLVDNCPDQSARSVAARYVDSRLRYVHEGNPGVVHARNRGVTEARGTYVIFLDDDEVPSAAWLDSWLAQADGVTDASFGRIVPRLLAPCPAELASQVARTFSRDVRRRTGADISDLSAYVGTGNAMFHKIRCLGDAQPFDPRFNARGGEDVWLIRGLVRHGLRLLWNEEALVEELVPADRMTLESLALRRFNQGQLRCIVTYGEGGVAGLFRASFWMLVGLIQWLGYSSAAQVAGIVAPSRQAAIKCSAAGGAGKLLWWRRARTKGYGAD